MNRETYGCPCCTGMLDGVFQENEKVRELKSKAESGGGWSCNWGIDWGTVGRRDFLKGGAASAGLAAMVPKQAQAQDQSTTIFTNGTVLTVDNDFSEVEAIAIRGNRILAVGTEGEVRAVAGDNATVVDLQGKTMLPGFIDAHTHVVTGSVVDDIMDYVGMIKFQTTDQVLDHIRARVAETPAGEWLVFRNFDPAVQDGLDALTFADLDPISTDHPIFVLNASGHLGYANSTAFEAAGVPADVEDPAGAEFVRDANGNLNGTIKNNIAYLQVLGAYPALADAQPLEALIKLLENWSALGMTTISELSLGALTQSPADAEILAAASQSGRLAARIRAYPLYSIGAEAWDAGGVSQGDGDAMARIAGYKLIADGSNQGFTGLQREPYLNSDDYGLAYTEQDELTKLAMERAEKGWHLAIHGNGDAAIDNILNTCEALRDAGIDMSQVRARIEHCSILHDDQIARMKELGVAASFLIGHVHYWGVAMRDEVFGEEKAQLLDRCRSVEEAGVSFTLHSDFMVVDPDPLHMIEMAVTRTTWKEPDYVLAPQETISVQSAIRAMTSEAAWQLFSDHEVGSLEPGKYADMVILDKDPRDVVSSEIKNIKVLETWMDGRQTFVA